VNIAVIPARGGSKRIPRKNVRPFCGRPMIAWAIETALRSGLFARVIVSTDDDEIATVAAQCGAEAPFRRPAELADDHAGTVAVMTHAAHWLQEHDGPISNVCCIYATAALLRAEDLAAGLRLLESGHWDYAFSVTEYASSIFRALRQHPSGGVEMFFPEHRDTRSQDLPSALHDAAQFYWGRADAWNTGKPIFGPGSAAVVLPRWRVQDVDTEDDWRRAEIVHRLINSELQHGHR
jgi:N-acylneuraminate cytidylyltransferase